ncbi:hypothetical protein IV102_16975 [bacterium]|nr:hypothetical protein [bacterium]
MKILVDADAIIKLTKAGLKEIVVTTFITVIPRVVEQEVVREGKLAGFHDAVQVGDNIDLGRLEVAEPIADEPVQAALFHCGDRAIVSHALLGGFAAVVTDDSALLHRLKQLGVSATVPAAIVVAVGRRRKLPSAEVVHLLDLLAPHISRDEYTTYQLLVEGRYPRK